MSTFIELPLTKRAKSLKRLVYGIGVNDADYQVTPTVDGKIICCPYYTRWHDMIERCYSNREKYSSYHDCFVCEGWLLFSNFKEWMKKQKWKGMDLDKDLSSFGNLMYSPESCLFLKPEINRLLKRPDMRKRNLPTGVYHKNKRFCALYKDHNKTKYIGTFDTVEDAKRAHIECRAALISKAAKNEKGKIKKLLLNYAQNLIN